MEKFIKELSEFIERESFEILGFTHVIISESCNNDGEKVGFHFSLLYNGCNIIEFFCLSLSEISYKWEQLKQVLEFVKNDKSVFVKLK